MSAADLRKWGLALGVALAFVGALVHASSTSIAALLWTAAVLSVGLAAFRPDLLGPIQHGFHLLTSPIRWVISTVVLSVVFFAIVTPLGFLLRRTGRIGGRPTASSYWVDRDERRDDSARAFRQS